MRTSCAGLVKLCRKPIATLSMPCAASRSASALDRRLVERGDDPAARVDPLRHDKAQPARHQRRRQVDIDVVLLEAVLVPDLDRVAKPSVVTSAVRAPLRSMIALVASVVP